MTSLYKSSSRLQNIVFDFNLPPDTIMSSIGPQLPPQLSKRKRTPEDDSDNAQNPPASPPAKNPRTQGPSANRDEIDLDDSDDDSDGYGPKPLAGPSMPANNKDEIDLSSDSGLETGPAPPVPPLSNPTAADPPDEDNSSSDDDDFGPSLPTAASKPQIGPSLPPSTEGQEAPQRDSWMLAPPTGGTFTERDPTKIRARKFASNSASKGSSSQPSSIWTETPEEKLKRLQDSVLGRSNQDQEIANNAAGKSKEQQDRDHKIAANIEAQRGKSLYEEHGQRRRDKGVDKGEEEDDPSKRGFDREKDMALGGRIGTAQRRELLNKAADFGGRFQKGSFL